MDDIDKRLYEAEEIDRLDLERYGLSDLEGKNLLALEEDEMDRLLEELGKDDVSLNVPMPCTPVNLQEVLSMSECRRCSKCCHPNPLNPDSPGVEMFKEELQTIAGFLRQPYESIEALTNVGKVVPYPFQKVKLSFTRWMPLPCPFFSDERNGCSVYKARPIVCKIHPIIFTGDDSYFSIKTNCDFGKDLVKAAFKMLRESDPSLEITL